MNIFGIATSSIIRFFHLIVFREKWYLCRHRRRHEDRKIRIEGKCNHLHSLPIVIFLRSISTTERNAILVVDAEQRRRYEIFYSSQCIIWMNWGCGPMAHAHSQSNEFATCHNYVTLPPKLMQSEYTKNRREENETLLNCVWSLKTCAHRRKQWWNSQHQLRHILFEFWAARVKFNAKVDYYARQRRRTKCRRCWHWLN